MNTDRLEEKLKNAWYRMNMIEAPFMYPDISPEAYAEEEKYLSAHYDDFVNGTYQPLWVQRGEKHMSFNDLIDYDA